MNRGDLERLYRHHGPAVLRRAHQILQHEAEAHDALQEIFLSLANDSSFEPDCGATAWFYIRTTNFCLNRLRDERNRARLRDAAIAGPASAPARSDDLVLARGVLAQLPAELADVAVYYYCDEMTHHEIATLLGCSRRHVGHLVERVHLTLKVAACG
jgi:RNA polymerase sigma-70 factor (ECF subfamily)